jgi:hypothetical protein
MRYDTLVVDVITYRKERGGSETKTFIAVRHRTKLSRPQSTVPVFML